MKIEGQIVGVQFFPSPASLFSILLDQDTAAGKWTQIEASHITVNGKPASVHETILWLAGKTTNPPDGSYPVFPMFSGECDESRFVPFVTAAFVDVGVKP